MKQWRVHSSTCRQPVYIFGETIEQAANKDPGSVAVANYDNVMRGEIKILSVEYKNSILGGTGGHVVTFEFEQGEPVNGRRLGESWIYSDANGDPRQ